MIAIIITYKINLFAAGALAPIVAKSTVMIWQQKQPGHQQQDLSVAIVY